MFSHWKKKSDWLKISTLKIRSQKHKMFVSRIFPSMIFDKTRNIVCFLLVLIKWYFDLFFQPSLNPVAIVVDWSSYGQLYIYFSNTICSPLFKTIGNTCTIIVIMINWTSNRSSNSVCISLYTYALGESMNLLILTGCHILLV